MNVSNAVINDKLDLVLKILGQQDKRLNRIEDRISYIEDRISYIEDRINRIEERIDRLEDKVDKIYELRDRVTVKFTRSWAFASFFIAVFSAMLVLVADKAF
jgi:archaellum component FlaC